MGDGVVERVTTGVMGFDALVEGGLPLGSNILITGSPGTGKTIFGLHYLFNGAMKGEPGIYVTLDSTVSILKEQARQFGMDLAVLEEQKKIAFLSVPITEMKFNLFDAIKTLKEQLGGKRIVFDNMATFAINIDLFTIPIGYVGNTASSVSLSAGTIEKLNMDDKHNELSVGGGSDGDKISYTANSEKRMIYLIMNELTGLGTTNLIITYDGVGGSSISSDGVSEFACDGLVVLRALAIGDTLNRTLEVRKMRCTKIDGGIKSYDIKSDGMTML